MSKRLIPLSEVEVTVCLKKTAIYKRISEGSFPKQISRGGNRVCWLESDIQNWVNERVQEARDQA